MIRWLVLRVGRTTTGTILIIGGLLLLLLLHRAIVGQPGIDPNDALAHGGHIVTVDVWTSADWGGRYEVKTLAGRPPKQRSGEFTDDVTVVVGPDWIGQIKVSSEGYCPDRGNVAWSAISDPIGGDFGWDEQRLSLYMYC
jgi:hypothetical protein